MCLYSGWLGQISVKYTCQKQVCMKKYQSFEANKSQKLSNIFSYRTEEFQAFIIFKTLLLNFIDDLPETVLFEGNQYRNHWQQSDIKKLTIISRKNNQP